MTLGENIARNAPGAVEAARALQQMRKDGMTPAELSKISGYSENHVYTLLKLIEHGEERLIRGVENRTIPINFAALVAGVPNEKVQDLLIDAWESGIVSTRNVNPVLKIINERMLERTAAESGADEGCNDHDLSIGRLKKEIQQVTKEREQFARQAKVEMNRVTYATILLGRLLENPEFVISARREGLPDLPPLSRKYAI